MQGLLSLVAGRHLTVEQANSEQLSGKLIQAKSDYLTILDQNGAFIHIQFCHIVSVVLNHAELVLPLDEIGMDSQPTFAELLRSLSGQIIRVEVGNLTNDGVVYQVSDKEISLILDMRHTIYYPIHHIQRFSLVQNSGRSDTSNDKNEGKTSNHVAEEKNTHKGKNEGKTVSTLVVQEQLNEGSKTSPPSDIAVIEADRQIDREKEKRSTASSNLTVFHVKQVDDLDEDSMEGDAEWYVPIPDVFEQKEIAQTPQMLSRYSDHAGASKLTLFRSMNSHFGNRKNGRRHKLP